MCEFKSGIAVRISEEEVRVYTLPLIDSHTVIRERHGIKENGLGMLSNMSTPVELIPHGFPPNFKDSSSWKFNFDSDKPGWWTEGMTEQATRQLMEAAKADFENGNEKEQLEAVKQNGSAIRYIKNPSEAVKMAAVKQRGNAIQFIKKPSEAVKMAAVKQNGYAIKYIKNPSESLQMAAVKQNGDAIRHIKNPSESLQMAAVKQNGYAIQFIKNPSEAVKQFVANLK